MTKNRVVSRKRNQTEEPQCLIHLPQIIDAWDDDKTKRGGSVLANPTSDVPPECSGRSFDKGHPRGCAPVPALKLLVGKSKRRIAVLPSDAHDEDRLTITSPTGEVELSIRLTPAGPVLGFSAADIQLSATSRVEVSSKEIILEAEETFRCECRGDRIDRVRGRFVQKAKSVDVEATLGEVRIAANDDVHLSGERIFLNK